MFKPEQNLTTNIKLSSCGIYMIFCKGNEKVYIGHTKGSFSRRFNTHISSLQAKSKNNRMLQFSWNKYGKENFVFMPLLEINKDEDASVFIHWENYFYLQIPQNKRFNAKSPLEDLNSNTKEVFEKRAKSATGRKRSVEFRNKLSASRKGMKFTDEHKENIRRAATISANLPEVKRRNIENNRIAQTKRWLKKKEKL